MITRTLFETKVTDAENSQIGRNIERMFVNVLYLILKVNQYRWYHYYKNNIYYSRSYKREKRERM